MNKLRTCALLMLSASFGSLCAQTQNDTFDSFRKEMYSNYNNFRKRVFDDYADYLDKVWKEYNMFKGEVRDVNPKPITPEVYKPVEETPVVIPVEEPETEPEQQPVPTPAKPQTPPEPVTPPAVYPALQNVNIDFYGMKVSLPDVGMMSGINGTGESAAAIWRQIKKCDTDKVVQALRGTAASYGLNDWFTFQLVRGYADAVAASGRNIDRVTIQHYLLNSMGYDVRLARTDRQYVLLVPIRQQVYVVNYIVFGDSKYYLYCDEKDNISGDSYNRIQTCDIPNDVDCGRSISLQFTTPVMISSGNSVVRTITDGKLSATAAVDKQLMEMVRHYPQTDIPVYAKSDLQPELKSDVLEQVRPAVSGLSKREAVNALLHFVQYSFKYATDGEQHGYEKPYFFEENFYYAKNDCEDRAVFFAYLVRNLLGLEVHLIHYPEHECTAVCFPDNSVTGDGYTYSGKRFVICDPTFIGASAGNCMPRYKSVKPEIELW
jgi:hypothetical protein